MIPTTRIVGTVGVVAGTIKARLFPPGQISKDSGGNAFKVGFTASSAIQSSQISSLYLAQTNSLSLGEAYYHVEIVGPSYRLEQLWKLNTTLGSLNVNSVAVLTNTPVYERTFY